MSNWGSLKLKWLRITARAEPYKSSLMGVPGISFQVGVRGLINVNLGVLDRERFEKHCSTVLGTFPINRVTLPALQGRDR